MRELMVQVGHKIAADGLTEAIAAADIGVGASTLRKHLAGEYVRSDSAAKYRRWLQGETNSRKAPGPPVAMAIEDETVAPPWDVEGLMPPTTPFRVVDLFSGCGGLSLGFDLVDAGGAFETVLAVDIEQAMLDVHDDNRSRTGKPRVGRLVDLADLTSEAEALAFYLDHLLRAGYGDELLRTAVEQLPHGAMSSFISSIHALDLAAAAGFRAAMESSGFRDALREVSAESIKQTSVINFHHALRLPSPGVRNFRPPLLWWQESASDGGDSAHDGGDLVAPPKVRASVRAELRAEWDEQIDSLRSKIGSTGRGQLASSARRIEMFLNAVDAGLYDEVFEVWLDWRSKRDALRRWYFAAALDELRDAYGPWQVGALVGGPPCQGFSRIGRGKIRSLRESGVQARVDSEAGDERNRLMFAYVLMVSALRPATFVFENVRHFQSEVKTPDGVFKAPELLAEAIQDISSDGSNYEVHSRIISAANHGVPQRRERFFMTGVRADAMGPQAEEIARWILALPRSEEVSLRTALEGLPHPHFAGGSATLASTVRVTAEPPRTISATDGSGRFLNWVRRDVNQKYVRQVDAHVARRPRDDDAAWFEMMGPGKRWLDYRVDKSPTLRQLSDLLDRLAENADLAVSLGLETRVISDLAKAADGSLALRLLLETLPTQPGELGHHLLTENYLSKRDGNHGDWLARLNADRPTKTMTSHMGKDTYSYVHPFEARTLSVREAARAQSFPDWFSFGSVSLVDGFRVIGNAVPPLLSNQIAERIFAALVAATAQAPASLEDSA